MTERIVADTQATPDDGILEIFRIEFREFWDRLPNKTLFFVLLGAWLFLFHLLGNSTLGYVHTPSLLRWMYNAYRPVQVNEMYDDSHGLWVPLVVLGLLWWKHKELMAVPQRSWWPAMLLLAGGVLLHLVGYGVQQPRVSILGMLVGLYGLIGLAWGPEFMRACFFPFFLLIFCIPFGSQVDVITFPLRILVCKIVTAVSNNILQIDVIRQGTALFDPGHKYNYDVAPACSGIRSLVATIGLSTLYGFMFFRRPWKRLLMMSLAVPFAVLGNVLRMMCIIIAAEIRGQSWGDWVHENFFFKLVPYIPAFIGLLLVGRWIGEDVQPAPPADEAPATPAAQPAPARP